MYASSAKKLDAAKSEEEKLAVLSELRRKLHEKRPSYEEFEANFGEILYSKKLTKQKKLRKEVFAEQIFKTYVARPFIYR